MKDYRNLRLKSIIKNPEIVNFPPEVILSTIPGVPDRQGTIYLNSKSRLRIRCPAQQAQQWYRLFQNQVLDIRGQKISNLCPEKSGQK